MSELDSHRFTLGDQGLEVGDGLDGRPFGAEQCDSVQYPRPLLAVGLDVLQQLDAGEAVLSRLERLYDDLGHVVEIRYQVVGFPPHVGSPSERGHAVGEGLLTLFTVPELENDRHLECVVGRDDAVEVCPGEVAAVMPAGREDRYT